MSNITPPSVPSDDGALEGPDVEVPTTDPNGTVNPAGLSDDSTIPNHPDGLAAGYSYTDSYFNPEEDAPKQ